MSGLAHVPGAVLVFLGGGVGACCRYGAGRLAARTTAPPVAATLLVNLSGSVLLGLIVALPASSTGGGAGVLLVGTGLLGGYTTFSTAAWEVVGLARSGSPGPSVLLWLGGTTACLAGAAFGLGLGSLLATGLIPR